MAVGPGIDRVKVGDRVAGTFFEGWTSGRVTERVMATARGGATQGMLAVDGVYVGSGEMFESMNQAIARTKTSPVIDRVFSFANKPGACEHLRFGRHFGKVVIRID